VDDPFGSPDLVLLLIICALLASKTQKILDPDSDYGWSCWNLFPLYPFSCQCWFTWQFIIVSLTLETAEYGRHRCWGCSAHF
jgi:hypothetical protein